MRTSKRSSVFARLQQQLNVQEVLTLHIIVKISIIMSPHYDILLSELIGITVRNEPGPQECAVFVLGSCQVPTSVLEVTLLREIKSSDTQRGLSGHMRRKHKMPLKGVWIEWSERTQPISFSWIRAFKPTLYYNQPAIQRTDQVGVTIRSERASERASVLLKSSDKETEAPARSAATIRSDRQNNEPEKNPLILKYQRYLLSLYFI